MTARGATLFAAYAYPPNDLGYCGPPAADWVATLGETDDRPFRRAVQGFEGAWPYLELIGGLTGLDPLDRRVVEAYWVGNGLLDDVDLLSWGNSIEDRFLDRSGRVAEFTDQIVLGRPTHAFHVFCVYPWVGLLRGGASEQALTVLDRCRVRWGTVVSTDGGSATVRSRALRWDGRSLRLDDESIELARIPQTVAVDSGSVVAMHWDWVCETLDPSRAARLESETARHLAIANRAPGVIETRLAS